MTSFLLANRVCSYHLSAVFIFFFAGFSKLTSQNCQEAKILIENSTPTKLGADELIKSMKRAVELCPNADIPHFSYASALEEFSRYPLGESRQKTIISAYKRAIQINSRHIGARYNLAVFYFKCDDYPLAQTEFEVLAQKLEEIATERGNSNNLHEQLFYAKLWAKRIGVLRSFGFDYPWLYARDIEHPTKLVKQGGFSTFSESAGAVMLDVYEETNVRALKTFGLTMKLLSGLSKKKGLINHKKLNRLWEKEKFAERYYKLRELYPDVIKVYGFDSFEANDVSLAIAMSALMHFDKTENPELIKDCRAIIDYADYINFFIPDGLVKGRSLAFGDMLKLSLINALLKNGKV